MAWIKKNPHLVVLVLIAVGAIAASMMLVVNASGFSEKFQGIQQPVVKGTKVFEQERETVQNAEAELKKPVTWQPPDTETPLPFVSTIKVLDSSTKLPVSPRTGTLPDSLTKKEIPNDWFLKNKLPLFTAGVTLQDQDGDGFLNEDEWRGDTNPNDKASHPPYYTRLFVKQYIKVPFLLKFQSADYDPKKPNETTIFINPLTLRKSTQVLHINDMVAGTKYKVVKYEDKHPVDDQGIEKDVSEVTLLDTEFNTSIILVKDKVTDSPESYMKALYIWPTRPGVESGVKKGQSFTLKPESEQKYKLLDINDQGAQIQTPAGEKVTIPNLPPGYPKP